MAMAERRRKADQPKGKIKMWSLISAGTLAGLLGFGWTANDYMHVKLQDRAEARVTHQILEDSIQIVGIQIQSAYDTQIEELINRIARLKEIRKGRPLTRDEMGQLEYYEKQLESAKKMRALQDDRRTK